MTRGLAPDGRRPGGAGPEGSGPQGTGRLRAGRQRRPIRSGTQTAANAGSLPDGSQPPRTPVVQLWAEKVSKVSGQAEVKS
jgi:hypothetical protein